MALNASSHVVVIDVRVGRGVDQANAKLKQTGAAAEGAGQKAQKAGREFHGLAGAFTSLFAAGMVKRGFEAILKPAIEYEQVTARLRVLTGANAAQMAKYHTRIKEVASISPYGPTEMAVALQELRRATGSTDIALAALAPTAQIAMASMGKMGLDGATRLVTETVKGFGLEAGQVTDAMERMAAVALATGVGVENFGKVMARMAVANFRGGQSLDEIATTFALAGRGVVEPERNIRLMSTAINMLQKSKPIALLGGIGVKVFDEATGGMRKLRDIWIDLAERYEKNPVEIQRVLADAFGSRGGESIGAVLVQLTGAFQDQEGQVLKGADAFKYLDEQMGKSTGLLDKFAKEWLGTTGAKLEIFIENVGILGKAIGTNLLPILSSFAAVLKPIAQVLTVVAESGLGGFIVKYAGVRIAIWGIKAAYHGVAGIIRNVSGNLAQVGAVATGTIGPVRSFFAAMRAEAASTLPVLTRVQRMLGATGRAATLATGVAGGKAGMWSRIMRAGRGGAITLGLLFVDEIGRGIKNIYHYLAGTNAGEDRAKFSKELGDLLDAARKKTELASRQMKEFVEQTKVGSAAMDELLSGFKSFASYEPPNIKRMPFEVLASKMGKVATGSDPAANRARYVMDTSVKTVRDLMPKMQQGSITGREQTQLMYAMEMMFSNAWTMVGRGSITAADIKQFQKETYGQLAKVSDPANRRMALNVMRAGGGRLATSGEPIPGVGAAAGAYGDMPSPEAARNYPLHTKYYPIGSRKVQSWGRADVVPEGSSTEAVQELVRVATADAQTLSRHSTLTVRVLTEIREELRRMGTGRDPFTGPEPLPQSR